jgi:hypothetical protein
MKTHSYEIAAAQFSRFPTIAGRLAGVGASNVMTPSGFLRQSVAKGINDMSHQHADAQNEACSYN